MKLITIVITAGTFLLGQAQETVRTWTSTQGSTLEASFLSREGEDVELVSKDGSSNNSQIKIRNSLPQVLLPARLRTERRKIITRLGRTGMRIGRSM